MAKVLTEALDLSCQKVETGNEGDLDRMSLVLAWCESFYRAGIGTVVDGNLGKQLRTAENGAGLLDSIEPRMIADIAALRVSAVPQVNSWNAEVTDGARFEPNPNFVGSDLVGGADADWMVGDVLIDCKTSERLTNPWIRNTLFQLLGYTLLDFEDSLHIRQLAIWVPRREAMQLWSLDQILGKPAEEALPKLRESFQGMLNVWNVQMAEEDRARRDAWEEWRVAFEAERQAEEDAASAQAEERKARKMRRIAAEERRKKLQRRKRRYLKLRPAPD